MTHRAYEKYATEFEGPLAVVRGCRLCDFHLLRHKAVRGRAAGGRGVGFREGNKQRGAIIQHIKTAHPAEYIAAMGEAS